MRPPRWSLGVPVIAIAALAGACAAGAAPDAGGENAGSGNVGSLGGGSGTGSGLGNVVVSTSSAKSAHDGGHAVVVAPTADASAAMDVSVAMAVESGVDAGMDSGTAAPPPGPPCSTASVDLAQMTLYSNPPDLASWPITTTLTEVDFTNDGVAPQFSKMDGTGRWPDVIPPGWGGPLQYTIGMAECIQGQWYASAVIEVWYGLPAAGGNVAVNSQVAMNWYYDAGRWGLLAGRQPATGETIGIFVASGNLRNITADDPTQSPVMERSNVVFVTMPDANGSTNSF